MQGFLDVLAGLSPVAAAGWFLAGNTMLVVVAVLGGTLLLRRAGEIRERRADRLESVLVVSAVVVNAAVGWVGWWLWRAGVIHVSPDVGPGAVVQFAVLVLAMDLALYLGHRAAHHRLVYPLVHRLHHRFTVPRPTTLFALHPVEAAGFGALWIVTLTLHPFAVPVLAAYGAVNLGFGTLGHLGVDPLPLRWRRRAVFRWLTTPMSHDDHHRHPATNLGFYTTIWDRLGGTLSPSYDARRTGTTS